MALVSSENNVEKKKLVKYRLFNRLRNKNETIEKRMDIPLNFEKFIDHKDKKYKLDNYYQNYYSDHDDVVYIEV